MCRGVLLPGAAAAEPLAPAPAGAALPSHACSDLLRTKLEAAPSKRVAVRCITAASPFPIIGLSHFPCLAS